MARNITKFGDFTLGDVVNLKTGGPDMVVEGFENPPNHAASDQNVDPLVGCAWFNEAGALARDKFPAHVLGIKASARDDRPSRDPNAPANA